MQVCVGAANPCVAVNIVCRVSCSSCLLHFVQFVQSAEALRSLVCVCVPCRMGNRNRTCKAELLFILASIQIAAEWRGCSALGPSLFAIFCGEYFAAQFCIWSRVGWASKNLETKPTVICVCALDRCRLRNACACVCQFVAPHWFGCHYCWSCQNSANCSCLAGSGRASLHYQMR